MELPMPRVSSIVAAMAVALSGAAAGAGSAQAAFGTAQTSAARCHIGYFCIYENRDFSGASLAMSACKTYNLHSYRFTDQFGHKDRWDLEASSWINNQTGGATATLTHLSGARFKAPADRQDKFLNPPWNDRVVRVKPC
jgi:hypothetical protein